MSAHAHWYPVVHKTGKLLDHHLKGLIAKRYMDHDGSLSGSCRLNSDDIKWLEGLRDTGVKDASVLIDAIYDNDEIEIRIE